MERQNKLIDTLTFSFTFIDCLYFKYRLDILKNDFCITNALCHVLFYSRSPLSSSQCRICSCLFFKNGNGFVSSIKSNFSHIFVNKFNNKTESLFAQDRKMTLKFDVLDSPEKYYELVDSAHNRCLNFLIVKNPDDLVAFLVYVRILTNIFYSISNDILQMPGKYNGRDIAEQQDLFLNYSVSFIQTFYFENICPLLDKYFIQYCVEKCD